MLSYYSFLFEKYDEGFSEAYKIDNYLEIRLKTFLNVMTYNYFFTTDSGLRYCVNFMTDISSFHFREKDVKKVKFIDDVNSFYHEVVLISFFPFDGPDEKFYLRYNDSCVVNRGEVFKIMATVKEALVDFLSKHRYIKYLFIGAINNDRKGKECREKLYLRYIMRYEPEWEIDKIYCEFMNDYYYIIKIK